MTSDSILIVDDDESVRTLLKTLLKSNGFKVLEAENGPQALKIASDKKPFLALVDLEMPLMSGVEVCHALSGDPSFTGKLIMVSAHKEPKKQVAGMASGASDYIFKPYDEEVLLAKVRAALRDAKKPEPPKDDEGMIQKGSFKLSEITRTLWLNGKKVAALTEIQFKMMKHFLQKSPATVSRRELMTQLFGNSAHDIKLIDIHIHHLKRRLGRAKTRLKNIYGRGYQLIT